MHNKAVLSCLALTALCVFGIQGKIKPYDMGISTDPYQTEHLFMGPVVQSIVSLTSSFVVKM